MTLGCYIFHKVWKWHDIVKNWELYYRCNVILYPTRTKNLERYLMCTFYYYITDHFWVGAEQPAAPHKNWQEKLLNIGFYRYYVRHIFSWVGSQSRREWFLIWLPPKNANKDWIYFFCILWYISLISTISQKTLILLTPLIMSILKWPTFWFYENQSFCILDRYLCKIWQVYI